MIIIVKPTILFCPNLKGAAPNELGLGLAHKEPKTLNQLTHSHSLHFSKTSHPYSLLEQQSCSARA